MEAALSDLPDDAALVAAVLAGRSEDFALLVERHQKMLTAFAQRQLGDPNLADDVVQGTFVKAWRRLSTFRGESSFRSWLCGIAINECRAQWRSAARRAEVPLVEAAEPATEEIPERLRMRSELRREVAKLPPRQLAVLSLRIYSDLAFSEIAHLEGVSVNAAKVSYHHAIRRLKEWLR